MDASVLSERCSTFRSPTLDPSCRPEQRTLGPTKAMGNASSSNILQPHDPATQGTEEKARPKLIRATSSTGPTTTKRCNSAEPTPLLSRPMLNRSATTTRTAPQLGDVHRASNTPARPSIVRRATNAIASSLELTQESSNAYKNRPDSPSYWVDHIHQQALLNAWDAEPDIAQRSKYPRSITAQLVSTEKQMLEKYPELGEGEVLLSREWMEYVLGICLRHPFCTSEKMGRWQRLAVAAGPRGNWGPW